MKLLVLGLGNPIVGDDSVGLRVAQRLAVELRDVEGIEVGEDCWGGLRLMERLVGYDGAVVVDAIVTGAPPGTLHVLAPGDVSTQRSASAHDVNLATALAFGRTLGQPLPADERIVLVGIEAEDILTFGEQLTPAVESAVPLAAAAVREALTRIESSLESKP